MPQHVTLSNGYKLNIPDGTPPDQVKQKAADMEALINPQWKGWSDPTQSLRYLTSYLDNPIERIDTAVVGNASPWAVGYNLGAGGINAAKSAASEYLPSLKNVPDLPTTTGLIQGGLGTPQQDPNAEGATLKRYAEAAITGLTNPSRPIMGALSMLTGEGGGDIGSSIASQYGGPYWEKVGRYLGTLGGSAFPGGVKKAASTITQKAAGDQAPDVGDAAQRLGVQPSFGSLSGTWGRTFEKAIGAIPWVGAPVQKAQQRMQEAIQRARDSAAEQVNQGPLPASIDPNSVGGNLITLARQKVKQIKDDFKTRYTNLSNTVGPQNLVDATPLLASIRQQANSPTLSGQQKQDILDRANYLENMTTGRPGYNGPPDQTPPGMTPPKMIPLGQLTAFRSELGDDISTMRGLDQTTQGPVRDAVTNAMQPVYARFGQGPTFNNLNEEYKNAIGPGTITDKLEAVGGRAVTGKQAPGQEIYEGGMTEKQAHDFVLRNTQSPSAIEPFVTPNSPFWRGTSSQFLNMLGNVPQGDFRSDTFSTRMGKISDDVLSQLTQTAGGATGQSFQDLRDAQTLGENTSVPVARHGLINSIGAFSTVEALMTYLAHHYANMGIPAAAAIPTAWALSRGLQSKTVSDIMSGQSTPASLADVVYQAAPAAATSLSLNNPDNQVAQPTQAPHVWSPLDEASNPPPPVSASVAAPLAATSTPSAITAQIYANQPRLQLPPPVVPTVPGAANMNPPASYNF